LPRIFAGDVNFTGEFMKSLAVAMIVISAFLSGCIVEPIGPGSHRGDGHNDRDGYSNRGDRDRDGVPNSQDRRPDDPRRY
jgi:hypothetical protein